MIQWVDIQWFGPTDYGGKVASGTTEVVDAGTTSQDSTTGVPSSPSSGTDGGSSSDLSDTQGTSDYTYTDPSGGSGSTPVIVVGTDYWLRDESGAVITDEYGDSLSLEGI